MITDFFCSFLLQVRNKDQFYLAHGDLIKKWPGQLNWLVTCNAALHHGFEVLNPGSYATPPLGHNYSVVHYSVHTLRPLRSGFDHMYPPISMFMLNYDYSPKIRVFNWFSSETTKLFTRNSHFAHIFGCNFGKSDFLSDKTNYFFLLFLYVPKSQKKNPIWILIVLIY